MDEIVVVDYDPHWPALFMAEAARLRSLLPPEMRLRVEHFGSTAVPGLPAKPIIDLAVAVRSLEEAKKIAVPALETVGYSFWRDNPDRQRLFFVKGLPPAGPRTHHLHMVEQESMFWERLLFRNYLRKYPTEMQRYAQLKQELMQRFPNDREAYTTGKTDYVTQVTQLAKDESAKAL